jgi:signal transduction histidine kinase
MLDLSLRKLSLNHMLTLILITISSGVLFINFFFIMIYMSTIEKQSYENNAKTQAAVISDLFVSPLAFFDENSAGKNLRDMSLDLQIELVVLYNSFGEVIETKGSQKSSKYRNIDLDLLYKNQWNGYKSKSLDWLLPWNIGDYHIWQPINVENEKLGVIYIIKSTRYLSEVIVQFIFVSISVFIFSVIIILLVSKKMINRVLEPIQNLDNKTQLISKTSNFSIRVDFEGKNEIASLYSSFNSMLDEIQRNQRLRDEAISHALSSKNELEILAKELESRVKNRTSALEESIDTLKSTQTQLVESEKMAALGSLVSGVAHEVNTPLGNALTGGSIIRHESKELLKAVEEGTLKKSTLLNKLSVLEESGTLLMKSLNQAASLVRGFKQISVDQSSAGKRVFNLHEYINEIIKTFHNKLKHVPVEVEVDGDDSIVIDSYPGSFAQIFNNLIQNTLLHAFEMMDSKEAKIRITFKKISKGFVIEFSDNGCGVSNTLDKSIFEPFITTKRNAGGTGLGLNIVYNIVTQKLRGHIEVQSEQGIGTTFVMLLPESILKES